MSGQKLGHWANIENNSEILKILWEIKQSRKRAFSPFQPQWLKAPVELMSGQIVRRSCMCESIRQHYASNDLTTWPIWMKLHRKHNFNVLS